MAKVIVPYMDYFALTVQRMQEEGLLLATTGTEGKGKHIRTILVLAWVKTAIDQWTAASGKGHATTSSAKPRGRARSWVSELRQRQSGSL
jgi:hypothetical protein